jgi:hypothetical protein
MCLGGLRSPAIDCHCMAAAVTDGGEGKQRGRQPLNAPLRIKERTTRKSKRHGQVAEHTDGDAGTSGRAAEQHGDVREN